MARKQSRTKAAHTIFSEASDERSWTTMLARMMNLVGTPALIFMAWTMWNGVETLTRTVSDMKTEIAVVSTELKNASDDKYRATQAVADFKLRDASIEALDKRVSAVESGLSDLRHIRPTLP